MGYQHIVGFLQVPTNLWLHMKAELCTTPNELNFFQLSLLWAHNVPFLLILNHRRTHRQSRSLRQYYSAKVAYYHVHGAGDGSRTHVVCVEDRSNSRYTTPAYKVASSLLCMHAPSLSTLFLPREAVASSAIRLENFPIH